MTRRRPPQTVPPRSMRAAHWLALVLTALAIATAWAAPARYGLDPVHTRVQFAVSHAGFSQALGTVSGSTGVIELDPDDWSQSRLVVSVPLQRIDLGDADWNRAVLARNLLDVQRWPDARFVSTRVEPLAADHFIVHGQLTLHGVTREVPLDVKVNAIKRHPMPPFRRTAGFSATAVISRAEFGIDAWPSVIGDRVELRIEAEASYGTRANEPEPTPTTNAPVDEEATTPRVTDPLDDPADAPARAPTDPASGSAPEPQEPTPP